MSLKKFEHWLLSQNLKSRNFIFPIDRILFKLGWKGPPISYLSFFNMSALFSLFYFIFFPVGYMLLSTLVLQDLTWYRISFSEASYFFLWLLGVSGFVGVTSAYSVKKAVDRNPLPPWSDFSNDQ